MCTDVLLSPSSLYAHGPSMSGKAMSRTEQESLPSDGMDRRNSRNAAIQRACFERSISVLETLVVDGTMGPSRLFDRLGQEWSVFKETLASLVESGLVKAEWVGRRRVFSPTDDGFSLVEQYLELRHRITYSQPPPTPRAPEMAASAVPKVSQILDETRVPSSGNSGSQARLGSLPSKAQPEDSNSPVAGGNGSPMVCQGCGRPVSVLSQEMSDILRDSDMRSRHSLAYECGVCKVVIFENELVKGRFVPPSIHRRNA